MPEINCVNTLDFPIVIIGRAGFSTLIHRTYVSRDKFRVRSNSKRTQAGQSDYQMIFYLHRSKNNLLLKAEPKNLPGATNEIDSINALIS